jgi:hypothetical protein
VLVADGTRCSKSNSDLLEETVKKLYKAATFTAFAFAAFVVTAIAASSAQAGPIVPPGHYCMTWDTGGSDCSFTSYDQCLATAAALDAECYGKTVRDDKADSRTDRRRLYDSQARAR